MTTPRKKPMQAMLETAKKGQGIDSLASVVEHFVTLSGGAKGLAKMLYTEYVDAKAGSLLRQRTLGLILQSWGKLQETNGVDDLGSLDDDDVERLLEERLGAITETVNAGTVNPDREGTPLVERQTGTAELAEPNPTETAPDAATDPTS